MPHKEKIILWIDDEPYALTSYKTFLEQRGYVVLSAYNLDEGKRLIKRKRGQVDLIILDIMMQVGKGKELDESEIELAKGGYESGLVLARWIKKTYPNVPILVYSAGFIETQTLRWFEDQGIRYKSKSTFFETIEDFVNFINDSAKHRRHSRKQVRTFIVHGHDREAKLELKNYIQNTLRLGEPIILQEQPSVGRSIIEKFEQEAKDVNLVFVLLTPDDLTSKLKGTEAHGKRARQNVIFELGYFLAKLDRKTGRVLLLYKGNLELPSDIAGLIYIDITNGIEAAGEVIRREVSNVVEST